MSAADRNAIGLFSGFLDDPEVEIYGVEPGGRSSATGDHAATITYGKKGTIHGFECYLLQDEKGEPLPVYSIASGLDLPGSRTAALLPQGYRAGKIRESK